MFDRNALLNDIDIESYADYLGIEKKRRGTRTFIRCPGHLKRLGKADRNISNAILTGQGYYCFTCNEYHNAIDMTQETDGCDFKTAAKKICIFLGKDYFKKTDEKPLKCPISKEDLKLIGIGIGNHKARAYTGYGNSSGEKVGYNTYLNYESAYRSIDELYREDYEAFSYMIGQKALYTYKKLLTLKELFSPENSESDGFVAEISAGGDLKDIKQGLYEAFLYYIERVEKIINNISLKNAA